MAAINKILVANRGEIACRILRTLQEMEIPSVAVHSDVDANAPHVWLADEAFSLGEPMGYLQGEKILEVCRQTGANAIHPGYGFLSENAPFAERCEKSGVVFIGPSAASMRALGDKRGARAVAEEHGVPVIPGAAQCDTMEAAQAAAEQVGYPVLLKAAGGGGGKGMRKVMQPSELPQAFEAARREALAAFADDRMLVEKYVYPARHVEVQILGDGKDVLTLGERECSLQRRYQKIIEESPSPGISDETRQGLFESAVTLARAVGYRGAGTVEFLVGPDGSHYFLEVNTRLQVEHPVTELRTGLDLVRAQVEVARGNGLPTAPQFRGHAIEARLNAEDPYSGFLPQTGKVEWLDWPHRPGLRIDSGIAPGGEILPHYDSMIAKVIGWGATREEATRRLIEGLRELVVLGLHTNQAFLVDVLQRQFFAQGNTFTTTIEQETFAPPQMPQVVQELVQQTLQGGAPLQTADHLQIYSPWADLKNFRMGQ